LAHKLLAYRTSPTITLDLPLPPNPERKHIRNLNNAVMGFWIVPRGLIRQFFSHNAYKLICRQLLKPNMQAGLP
jgi:hypothetical protein